jgi:hypothetical protein
VLSSNPERDEQDLCEYARCSTNATCEAGACTCEPDYIGDPYALDGCQPTAPAIIDSCVGAEDCGAGATCVEGRCACEAEAVGTCGDRTCVPLTSLCDDQADCASGYDEEPNVCRPTALLDWLLTDSCDDGLDVEFRLWAQDREWVWPGGDEVYETPGVSVDALQRIACAEGELVCFGGRAGAVEWGLGLDGQGDCSECCTPCTDGVFDLGFLTCG